MLYHFPIEPYIERYTSQLCGEGENGWLESRWLENQIPFTRIAPDNKERIIKKGAVLDACDRSKWCFHQLNSFIELIDQNKITSEDTLYFADFWHPGMEALKYIFHIIKIHPKMYAFCHAQSVDQNDFTFEMLPWIRHYEKGNGAILDGIFVNCKALKNLLVKQEISHPDKIHVNGHIYNSKKVKEMFPDNWGNIKKKKQVVYSSRIDTEKDPYLFLKLANYCFSVDPEIKFVVTTSSPELRSNDPKIVESFLNYPFPNLDIRVNQTKTQYYETLLESKIQFNCADQDFISYCLLEALTCECIPVYPNYLSFPEVLPKKYLYDKGDYTSASNLVSRFISEEFDQELKFILLYHDNTWEKILQTMRTI